MRINWAKLSKTDYKLSKTEFKRNWATVSPTEYKLSYYNWASFRHKKYKNMPKMLLKKASKKAFELNQIALQGISGIIFSAWLEFHKLILSNL